MSEKAQLLFKCFVGLVSRLLGLCIQSRQYVSLHSWCGFAISLSRPQGSKAFRSFLHILPLAVLTCEGLAAK